MQFSLFNYKNCILNPICHDSALTNESDELINGVHSGQTHDACTVRTIFLQIKILTNVEFHFNRSYKTSCCFLKLKLFMLTMCWN